MVNAQDWLNGLANKGDLEEIVFNHDPDRGDDGILVGDLVIDGEDFPNVRGIRLNGRSLVRKMNLTGLMLQNFNHLIKLSIENNDLNLLDIRTATNLQFLDASYNPRLTVLDLTNNQELRYLDLKRAKLIKEDVKGLDSLLKLHCYIGGDVPSYDTYFGFDDDDDDDVVPLPFDQIKKNFEKDYVFFTGSLEAIDGHEIKYLLRKPVDQGGAGALAADEVDPAAPNTNDLLNDDTDADTSGWNDIEKWLKRKEDTVEEWIFKKNAFQRIIFTIQAGERFNEYLTAMDIDSDVVKDRLNNRTGLPGAVGSTGNRLNVAPDDEVAIADGQTCAEWLLASDSIKEVLEKESYLNRAIAILNSERINSKVNAIAVIEAARSKQFPTEIPHDGLVTGLKGNFAGAGPYMDADYSDDETGWHQWINDARPDEVEDRKNNALLSIFHEQAFRRVDEYQADAGVSNDEIKNKVNELVGAGTIGDVDNWVNWLDDSPDLPTLFRNEQALMKAIGILSVKKEVAVQEVGAAYLITTLWRGGFNHAHFIGELNRTVAQGGANAAIAGNGENDWKNWLRNSANDNDLATRKKTALKIMTRFKAHDRVKDYLINVAPGKTDADLQGELSKALGTDGGQGLNFTADPNLTSWKDWLRNSADIDQVSEREAALFKAAALLKNTDHTLNTKITNTQTSLGLTAGQTLDNIFTAPTALAPNPHYIDLHGQTLKQLAENWDKASKFEADIKGIDSTITGSLTPGDNSWINKLAKKSDLDQAQNQVNLTQTELGLTGDIDAAKLAPFKNASVQVVTLKTQKNDLQAKITTVKNKLGELDEVFAKLGTKKLSDIPAGKTLEDLINNPDAAGLQAQIDTLKSQLTDKEAQVIKSIHDELSLGLTSGEITQAQVLAEIKKLIADKGGGSSDADKAEITRLKEEIDVLKKQPDTIVKEAIVEKIIEKEAEKTYGVVFTTQEITQIKSAANAQEALKVTNEIIKSKFQGLQSLNKSTYTLNWILVGLIAVSLLALAYLLVKRSGGLPETENKSTKKKK